MGMYFWRGNISPLPVMAVLSVRRRNMVRGRILLAVIGHIEPLLTLAVSYAAKVFFLPKEEEQVFFHTAIH